ncbi:conjugative transposon protein TraN [Flavobacterium dauae]|uniref:conjugative transposon protein TraN n=1 Tax=Flavobacterium dauae TaxID=1563479 RepID=UPI00101B32A8|nr:conjugative transposon protein TraN [Flavobacterium dauae]WLD24307.1 conjugative transposon protein TraN [Flavobacterium dauae]
MKAIVKSLLTMVCLTAFSIHTYAQQATSVTNKLSMGKVEPYQMQVTYNKTSHLIFPAAIRYVDLGSEYLIAGKAEDAENVLRIKAAVKDFEEETNFSVITGDGRFYNFNVFYSPDPSTLNYDLLTMQKASNRENGNDVLFEELGNNSPSLAGLILETIYKKNKRIVKHIGSKSYGIQFLLKGIYVHNGKFYFHTELKNQSNVPFTIDFVNFKIVDKKVAKRTVMQEKSITPLRIYKPLDEIAGTATDQNVFLLDQFTITDDKVLMIEIFEKNGGRQQVLEVEHSDLVHAKPITDMHLKIN